MGIQEKRVQFPKERTSAWVRSPETGDSGVEPQGAMDWRIAIAQVLAEYVHMTIGHGEGGSTRACE